MPRRFRGLRSERKRMEEDVVDAILQQSARRQERSRRPEPGEVLEEEQKQLTMAMKESKEPLISLKVPES